MVEMIVQIAIIALWASMLVLHTRRLFRLAHVEVHPSLQRRDLGQRLRRVWWWLGREEFWRKVQADTLRCMEVTLMAFLLIWNM